MENTEINLKSENLLDDYKARELEIMETQLKIAKIKEYIEGSNEYKEMKENEEKIRIMTQQNNEYKETVKNKMLDSGLKSLETFSHKITVKGTVGSLKIENDELVPQEYIKEVKPIFDNAKIKSDIKDGKNVPGCNLVEGRSLVITEK